MTAKERKQMSYLPSEALDAAVNERFGANVQCTTRYSLFSGSYNTEYNTEDSVLRSRITDFIEGFKAGNIELRERLADPSKFLG